MEIHYGPWGLHSEIQSGLDRLMTQRRQTRRMRRGSGPRRGVLPAAGTRTAAH